MLTNNGNSQRSQNECGAKKTLAISAAQAKLLKSDSKIDTMDKKHVQNVNRNALKVAMEQRIKAATATQANTTEKRWEM